MILQGGKENGHGFLLIAGEVVLEEEWACVIRENERSITTKSLFGFHDVKSSHPFPDLLYIQSCPSHA